tara:strand:+ start:122 stop:307 length:186 start_codon:yes stop_codon:yes gene_type:complete
LLELPSKLEASEPQPMKPKCFDLEEVPRFLPECELLSEATSSPSIKIFLSTVVDELYHPQM